MYIDDVISNILRDLASDFTGLRYISAKPEYKISLGALAAKLEKFKNLRKSLFVEKVGIGLDRALYATFMSYIPTDQIIYDVKQQRLSRKIC